MQPFKTYFLSYLDPKEQSAYENKTHTFSVVYKMLTGIRARYTFDPTM